MLLFTQIGFTAIAGLRGLRRSAWVLKGGLRNLRNPLCHPWGHLRSMRKAHRGLWHTCDNFRNTTLEVRDTCASCAGCTKERGAGIYCCKAIKWMRAQACEMRASQPVNIGVLAIVFSIIVILCFFVLFRRINFVC